MTIRVFSILLITVFLSGCLGSQNPAPVTRHGGDDGGGSAGVHTVVSGDTLWSVSQRYSIPIQDIVIRNKLNSPYKLARGQRLFLPAPTTYRVREGDNLYKVSQIFDVGQFEIAQQNNLQSPYRIRPGQVLRLPSLSKPKPQPAQKPVYMAKNAASPKVEREDMSADNTQNQTANADPQILQPSQKPNLSKPKTRVTKAPPSRASSQFLKPVDGRIVSSYGPKEGGLHNDGINIAAARGTPVMAAENGVVVYAGNELKGSGNLILVRHADRWLTAYAHLDGFTVERGATVKRGQVIGKVGSTGAVSTPQLHFEIRRGTEALNPAKYLDGLKG